MTTLTRNESLFRARQVTLVVAVFGVVIAVLELLIDSTAFFRAYLVGFAFVASLSLGCLFMLMINYVTGGHWGRPLRRVFEVGAQSIWVTALLFIPLLIGLAQLYPWAQQSTVSTDPLLQHQSALMNPAFFVLRSVIYFAVWILLGWRMTRPDTEKRKTAIIGLILHFPLATMAAVDWFMSLEPHWYSTLYGVLFLATQALTAYAFALSFLLLVPTPAPEVSEQQTRQDLGNVLLTVLIASIYLEFMQFLVIWAGDLPEEISWYLARMAGGWSWIVLILIGLNIVVPFVLLLSIRLKNRIPRLALVALLMLIMQFLYAYWLVRPAFGPTIGWIDLVLPLGISAVWLAVFIYRLQTVREGNAVDES